MSVYQYNYAEQAISFTAEVEDVFQHSFVQGSLKMADVFELPEAHGEGLLGFVE